MNRHTIPIQGFTLVELIAIIVMLGVLSSVTISLLVPNAAFQLQGGRDTLITALFQAQQRAMNRSADIQLTTNGRVIDIRQDDDGNGVFSIAESVRVGGITYPLELEHPLSLSSHSLQYDDLGETTANTIRLSHGDKYVDVTVSKSGFAF